MPSRIATRLRGVALIATLCSLALASSAQAAAVTVDVGQGGNQFVAQSVTISAGQTVHWTWDGSDHSVTSGSPPGTPDGGFDSGIQNQGATFDHTFSKPGVYHYFCQVHYAQGMVGTVTVTDTPIAAFSTSPAAPVVGHAVSFDASASSDPDGDPIAKYVWSFGDGSTETTSNPTNTHVYGAAGSFAVSLTVQDAQSNSSAAVKHTIKIVADKPTARFTAQRSKPTVGETVKFDGSASSDADGDAITSYQWSFGDGSTLTTSTPSTTHAYGSVGSFKASLTVLDSLGNASTAVTRTIQVSPPYPVPTAPTARFTYTPGHPVIGQLVTFNASKSSDRDGDSIKRYRWSFGDHSTKTTTSAFITHGYSRLGSYAVTLVVTDSHGTRSAPASHVVRVVAAPPRPRITALHVRVCRHRSARCRRRGLQVRFTLTKRDTMVLTIRRRHHRRTLRRVVIIGHAGDNFVRLRFRRRPGRYVLSAHAFGDGTAIARFRWRRP